MKLRLPYEKASDLSFYDKVKESWFIVMPSVYAGGAYMVRKFMTPDFTGDGQGVSYGTLRACVEKIDDLKRQAAHDRDESDQEAGEARYRVSVLGEEA